MRRNFLTSFVCLGIVLFVGIAASQVAVAQEQPELNPIIMRVNGEPIYAADVSMAIQSLLQGARAQGKTEVKPEDMVEPATRMVVQQEVVAQEARKLGLKPVAERVEATLAAAQKSAGGPDALEANLRRAGSSTERLRETIEDQDLIRVYAETRIAPSIEITDEETERFYNENPELFTHDELARARQIVFGIEQGADPTAANDAFTRATEALERARSGEDFSELARELSEGPSAPRGGDIGFFSAAMVEQPIADAVFKLEPGEISDVVRTRFGYHVFKVEERQPAGTFSLDEARDQVHNRILRIKIAEQIKAAGERLEGEAEIEEIEASAGETAP